MKRARSLTRSTDNSSSNAHSNSYFNIDSKSGSRNELRNVVVCITGLSPERKANFHRIVDQLGGRYTGDLIIEHTTHLIAEISEGAKYIEAVRNKHIIIVKPSWLEACETYKKRIPEKSHLLEAPNKYEGSETSKALPQDARPTTSENNELESSEKKKNLPLREACEKILTSVPFNSLFISCSFFFVGYQSDFHSNPGLDQTSDPSKTTSQAKDQLAQLVRHGMGTRYWDLTQDITHVIVDEFCDLDTLNAAKRLGAYHPNQPAVLSPYWLLESQSQQALQPFKKFIAVRAIIKPVVRAAPKLRRKYSETKMKLQSTIFQGMIFTLNSPSQSDRNDTNIFKVSTAALEHLIVSNGGLILTRRILEALHKDKLSKSDDNRILGVVFPGIFISNYEQRNPLLLQVKKRKLCSLLPVNTNYILACIDQQLDFSPDTHPILFQPQPYHLQMFDSTNNSSSLQVSLKISVTGFTGYHRSGIVRMLAAVGVEYTDNLTQMNTHLICKKPEGAKFIKGLEWRMHVVSVDWFYHILRYGYNGKRSRKGGCEDLFNIQGETDGDATSITTTRIDVIKKAPENDVEAASTNEYLRDDQACNDSCISNSMLTENASSEQDKKITSSLQNLKQPPLFGMDSSSFSRQNIGTTTMKKRMRRRRMESTRKRRKVDISCATIMEGKDEVESSDEDKSIRDGNREEQLVEDNDGDEDDSLLGTLVESQAVWYG